MIQLQKREISWQPIQAALVLLCIALGVLKYFSSGAALLLMRTVLFPLSFCAAGLAVFKDRILENRGVRLLALLFLWALVSMALNFNRVDNTFSDNYYVCLCVTLFLCFTLFPVTQPDKRNRLLLLLAAVTVGLLTLLWVLSLLIYIRRLPTSLINALAQRGYGLMYGLRFQLFVHPNVTGRLCTLTILLAAYIGLARPCAWCRSLCGIAALLAYLVLGLTDSQASLGAAAIGIAVLVFVLLRNRLSNKKAPVVWIASLAAGLVVAVAIYGLSASLIRPLNALREGRLIQESAAVQSASSPDTAADGSTQPALSAEAAATPAPVAVAGELAAHRVNTAESLLTLTNRTALWKGVSQGLSANPDIYLRGATVGLGDSIVTGYFPVGMPRDIHNAFLSLLVSYGIPGLLLFLIFLCYIAIQSLRLVLDVSPATTLAQRYLPGILLAILAIAFVESILLANDHVSLLEIWFFLICGYIAVPVPNEKTAA